MAKKKDRAKLADYRFAGALDSGAGDGKGRQRREAFDFARIDPGARPFLSGDKTADKAAVASLALELDHLQDLLYADRRFKLLVVLQGTDTSGKDGTIRGV
ncbi:MAG TPA: polyphosphate--nucleotide phosphotransferase, partial [Caldimonas sp.]|nr:polyphosphate--nucleotide phosphotransferase [Caldimonas sp.]